MSDLDSRCEPIRFLKNRWIIRILIEFHYISCEVIPFFTIQNIVVEICASNEILFAVGTQVFAPIYFMDTILKRFFK